MVMTISTTTQRRYILGKQGLWPGRRWHGLEGTAQAIHATEAVQIDPVSVVACSHDIVLWGRVSEYQPEYLQQQAYEERRFFDYGGWLRMYPMAELPYWRPRMLRYKAYQRWQDFAATQVELVENVRQVIRDRGPLRSRDLAGEAVSHYRAGKDTGVALYYLWLTGELMTHGRQGKERVYDFLENIAPTEWQHSATEEESANFFLRKDIANWGLITMADFRRMLKDAWARPLAPKEAQHTLARMLAAGELAEVRIEGQKDPAYFLGEDMGIMAELADGRVPVAWQTESPTTTDEVIFLSPLEFVSARGRAAKLFGFDYIWEIYKPAEQRQYGPYTMPILYGDRLVGRMDSKFDRAQQTYVINGLWLEDWFHPDSAFAAAFAQGLQRFADFLGAARMDTAVLAPAALRAAVEKL